MLQSMGSQRVGMTERLNMGGGRERYRVRQTL